MENNNSNLFNCLRFSFLKMSPMRVIFLGFLTIITLGTILLSLPISSQTREFTNFIDSFFTSTSATCVTGLIRFDTYTHWSWFGKAVILCLIQIGGLGFMTMAISIIALTKKRIGIDTRVIMQNSISAPQVGGIVKLTKKIFIGTAIIEGSGAVLLSIHFIPRFGVLKGIIYSIFHSVSAFCNAGFDLMGYKLQFSSLTGEASNWYFNIVIMLLITVGGLGFVVWFDLINSKFRFKALHLQSKLVLVVSVTLTILGTVVIFLFELNGTLYKNMSLGEQILVSMFQSVTSRTAGFNTINLASLTDSSLYMMIILMFIGGSTGSTAGGLKTTTFAVLILTIFSTIKRKTDLECFGRRLEDGLSKTATCLFTIYIMLSVTTAMIISNIENISILQAMFECVSAIATVGLTLGVTPNLGSISEIILIILMMIGRIGSITVLSALFFDKNKTTSKLAQEKVQIG
ncbi:MAG: potassium transporter TrkG [Acutalibacteraceae bacterium]|nr:potassium transporter TrkG [Acutalibacteraceae bacterium]